MKLTYLLFAFILICNSCKTKTNKEEESSTISTSTEELPYTMEEDSIGDATAVLWVDKNETKKHKIVAKGIKAKVSVSEDGKVTVIAFVKDYPKDVQSYIKHKLLKYTISEDMMKHGYIKTGEQFMQFRYNPQLMSEHKHLQK